jgi:hypothetical protein
MGKILAGIVLIIVFLATLFIVYFPIIWIGAGITGAWLIYSGLRESTAGEGGYSSRGYQCKLCSFKGHTKKTVILHVIDSHQDSFSPEQLEDMQALVDGKTHKCVYCGHWVSNKEELISHALEEHQDEMTTDQVNELRNAMGLEPI